MKKEFTRKMKMTVLALKLAKMIMESLRKSMARDIESSATEEYLHFEIAEIQALIEKYKNMIELNK